MTRLLRLKLLVVLVALLAAVAVAPVVHTQTAPADVPRLDFEKYTLSNGLTVILHEDHRLPMVAVNLWYHVGPANERPGRTGFAHLFEHMMFQGSTHVDEHFKILEGAGASDINGTTDFDRTNYFETLPSNQLELALWLESDRMGYLLDRLDAGKLANQQTVVRNERRQSVENQPFGIADEEVYHLAYPKGHPYYADVIGSHQDIQAAKLEDVKEFFKTYYAPNNASLAIVGDIDRAKTRQLIEKYFGSLKPSAAPVPKIEVATPPISEERRSTVTDHLELPRLAIVYLDAPIYKPGDAEGDVAARILGGGKSSRLYKTLVYEKRIAQEVSAQHQSLMLGSLQYIQATAAPGHKLEELEAAIDAEVQKLQTEAVAPREIEAARNTIESQIIRGLERLGGFGGVADRLNAYNHYLGDPGYLPRDIVRYRQVDAAALQRYAQTYLKKTARVVVYAIPGEQKLGELPPTPPPPSNPGSGAEAVNADQPWRAAPPAAGAASKASFPTPQQFKLPNGLTVLLAERHDLPIVSANLTLRTGGDGNPPDMAGLADFTASMLDEGTAKRATLEIAADVEQIGATLAASTSVDSCGVRVRFLKKTAPAALDLLSDVALHPAFPAAEVDRLRQERLTAILQDRENPQSQARKTFMLALFGENHPYGSPDIGTEASVKATTRDAMEAFWKKYFVPSNAALVFAGDVTPAEARAWAEQYFGSWTGAAPAQPTVGAPATTDARVIIVDKPGAQQTVLRTGLIGTDRSSPDYMPLRIMNGTLGGLFSSRINLNLREKHGYTYGAGSNVVFYKHPGYFFAASAVRTDVTAPALKEMLAEIAGVATGGITEAELRMARDYITRSLPGLFETTPEMASAVETQYVYGLPLDYYAQLPARVEAVTTADVKRVAAQYLHPEKLVIVAVGDRAKIEEPIRALNLGKVEVRSAAAKTAQ